MTLKNSRGDLIYGNKTWTVPKENGEGYIMELKGWTFFKTNNIGYTIWGGYYGDECLKLQYIPTKQIPNFCPKAKWSNKNGK